LVHDDCLRIRVRQNVPTGAGPTSDLLKVWFRR
jgi:hypothetical protein